MLFNSLTFLVFFAIVLALHSLPLRWTARKLILLSASYVFYAAWNPPFVALLWISTVVDYVAGRRIAAARGAGRRRFWLVASLCTNLGLLGFFKYANFALDSFVALLHAGGVHFQPLKLDLVLPVGISFYTFQTMSYTIDVYRGALKPSRSFLDFALFVTFFPQLVAGPIVRAADFLPQLDEPKRPDARHLVGGLLLLAIGLFEKVIVANLLAAPVADKVFASARYYGGWHAWVGTMAFSAQIFFDFAGYSTCAIGAAMCLGFRLPDNFRFPYAAVGFSDFWRRWHISLSTWLRDYLYISLGGNRKGKLRTYVNLMLTMLLGGLWHGASWKFVIWGGLHGFYLIGERLLGILVGEPKAALHLLTRVALGLFTYLLVLITWVFFRAINLELALGQLRAMFTGQPMSPPDRPELYRLSDSDVCWTLGLTAVTLLTHWIMRNSSLEAAVARLPWWARGVLLAALVVALALSPGDERAFIYFQF